MRRIIPSAFSVTSSFEVNRLATGQIPHDCGKVIEFSDDSIESRQREIAARHGIRLTNHSLYLYGHCAEGDCREDDHAHDAK